MRETERVTDCTHSHPGTGTVISHSKMHPVLTRNFEVCSACDWLAALPARIPNAGEHPAWILPERAMKNPGLSEPLANLTGTGPAWQQAGEAWGLGTATPHPSRRVLCRSSRPSSGPS
jgi:hypothetical protein